MGWRGGGMLNNPVQREKRHNIAVLLLGFYFVRWGEGAEGVDPGTLTVFSCIWKYIQNI